MTTEGRRRRRVSVLVGEGFVIGVMVFTKVIRMKTNFLENDAAPISVNKYCFLHRLKMVEQSCDFDMKLATSDAHLIWHVRGKT